MKKKILVTGASGFIGRNVAEHFASLEEYEVFGTYYSKDPYQNPKIKLIKANLTLKEKVDEVVKGMDIIVQCAAVTSGSKDTFERPHIHIADTSIINSMILKSAFDHKVSKFIFPSCTVLYTSKDRAIKEDDFDPRAELDSKYFAGAWNKIYLEKMCEFYSNIGPTQFSILRHSNVYGPHDKYDPNKSHVFAATLLKVMNEKEGGIVKVWGDGSESRDLIHVEDFVNFVQLVIENQKEKLEIFNVGLGIPTKIKDLVQKFIEASGKKLKIEYQLDQPTIKTNVYLDCSKAKNEIGWTPKINIDAGIRKTIKWYQSNN